MNAFFLAVIEVPNPQYIWDTTNGSVATVDPSGLLTATTLGDTSVHVHYISIPFQKLFRHRHRHRHHCHQKPRI